MRVVFILHAEGTTIVYAFLSWKKPECEAEGLIAYPFSFLTST